MSDEPVLDGATTRTPDVEASGTLIGRYRILQKLGEGGFGEVFEAEQTHPVRRRVALKVIKPGMDSRDVIARFMAERQALALMDHPHIARVLDAGTTDGGQPYFVMELVAGEPVTAYCDRHNLSVTERLAVFEQVCTAVQHAHGKGVIHRDLKPSNVLVGTHEDQPFAKVIDFGIAKATGSRLTDNTLFTAQNQMIGTPLYMSPEQAEGSADIDTRSDVYSLGVLLYQLLTGTTPFESVSIRGAAHAEIQRILREVDPPRPSVCLSRSQDTLNQVAAHRRTDPVHLARQLRGELDWIVMKAIEKDRSRRYETANGLAMDVRRYLSGQPVLAAPPSAAYRMRKFVRRHRGAVAAGILLAISLLVGMAGFAWQASIATRQARIAEQRASELEQVSSFQAEMLGQVDPTRAGLMLTEDVLARFDEHLAASGTAEPERAAQAQAFEKLWLRVNATDAASELINRTILEPAVAALDSRFRDQPLVDATLRQVLAERYQGMGMAAAALPLQRRVLEVRRQQLGDGHPLTVHAISRTAELLEALGQLKDAEPYYREALELGRRALGNDHAQTLTAISNMGTFHHAQGQWELAEPLLREALDARRRVLGEGHRDTLASFNNLGGLFHFQGRLEEAEPYYRKAVAGSRAALGDDDPDTLAMQINLAALLVGQSRFDEARAISVDALERARRVLGERHPHTLYLVSNLGVLLRRQGKLAEAEPHLREALRLRRRALGDDHPTTLSSIRNLGVLLHLQGKLVEAEVPLREVFDQRLRLKGPEHAATLESAGDLASLLVDRREYAQALALLAPREPAARVALAGGKSSELGQFLMALGKAQSGQGQFEAAERVLLEAHASFDPAAASDQRVLQQCAQALVSLYRAWHAAEPGRDHAQQAARWQQSLER
ncbi:MAG: serine/threonine protein kinase [Xanthomonadales bacterium]|nr:serine/threonine protein kinase [Xanthomonadales bacterium]